MATWVRACYPVAAEAAGLCGAARVENEDRGHGTQGWPGRGTTVAYDE